MYWVNFLHIYQPGHEPQEIFDRVVSESYRPLFQSLFDNPKAKLSLNINAVLTERLEKFHPDLIEQLRHVANRGQVEFTDSAKYHALLPLLPLDEIERQIALNRETNQRIFGDCYNPVGVFPPEMGYSPKLIPVLEKMGYKWIIVDEIAYDGKLNQIKKDVSYKISGSNINVFFRERAPSNLIMGASVRREEDLKYYLQDDYTRKNFMITGMDGETFGHHRPGLHVLLTELLNSVEFDHAFFSDLLQLFPATETVTPVVSTWASSEKDIEDQIQFISWNAPDNEIQNYQWELQHIVLDEIKSTVNREPGAISRLKLDEALASDQFFWSSAKPWWSLEEIERGAWLLLDALRSLPDPDQDKMAKAYDLYLKILAKSFEWQRTGHVRELSHQMKEAPRIPFKDRTSTEPWVYKAFVEMLKTAQKQAADKENFEEAILWRDAIWKLETKNDVFEAVHVIDLLRKQVPNTEILDIINKYKLEHDRLVSGQPEQRGV